MATSDIPHERVQALLKLDTGDGSVYSHIVKLARVLSLERPTDAVDIIEDLSHRLKKGNFRGEAAPDPELDIVVDCVAEDKRQKWCQDTLKLARQPSDPLSAPKVLGTVQCYMEDAAMFEWAGVGFGKQENFRIAMSLRKLAAEVEGLDKLRLWGKVFGAEADYYVAEGSIQVPSVRDQGPPPKPVLPGSPEYDVEPRGEGANACAYWVSTGGSAPWIRLPAARASHVVAARRVKRLLTGDLGSPVFTTPWFPGKERHYLRAQIARISATCALAVSNYYEPDDAEDAKKFATKLSEGWEDSFKELRPQGAQENWVHAAPGLLSTGKTSWPNVDDVEEGVIPQETIDAIRAQAENEAEKAPLQGISTDLEHLKPEGAEDSPAWNIKVYGDKGQYAFPEGSKSYRITAVRSLIWPGAICVAQGSRFANLYVGYGQKCATLVEPDKESGLPLPGASPFSSGSMQLPLAPEDVMEEPNDQEEQEEPQPPLVDDASDGEDMEPADE